MIPGCGHGKVGMLVHSLVQLFLAIPCKKHLKIFYSLTGTLTFCEFNMLGSSGLYGIGGYGQLLIERTHLGWTVTDRYHVYLCAVVVQRPLDNSL